MDLAQNFTIVVIAFQWDAYHLLVDHIPACTGQGGVCIPACTGQGGVYPSMHWAGGVYPSMHWAGGCLPGGCLPGGVCTRVCVPRGCVYPGGCLPRIGGLSSQRVSAQGVSAHGCMADTSWTRDRHLPPPPCEQNDRQV